MRNFLSLSPFYKDILSPICKDLISLFYKSQTEIYDSINREFLPLIHENQAKIADLVLEDMQYNTLKKREARFAYLFKDNVHPIAARLHPDVVYRVDGNPDDSAYRRHQSRKHGDKFYQQKIPVFVDICEKERGIIVEIDCWASEGSWDLSSYGISQFIDLLGLEAFDEYIRTTCVQPLSFFGNHFFCYGYADAAIRLANFAARRDYNPDFQYWHDIASQVVEVGDD